MILSRESNIQKKDSSQTWVLLRMVYKATYKGCANYDHEEDGTYAPILVTSCIALVLSMQLLL